MTTRMSSELLNWNYNNLFKEMYLDKENKTEPIFYFVTEISGAANLLNEEEKKGVAQIIKNKNAELENKMGEFRNSKLESFEELLDHNQRLKDKAKRLNDEFWDRAHLYYEVGEEGRAIM
jgi:hypothetical protein